MPATHRALLSLADAADYLDVDVKTCRRYIAAGRLPAYRIAGSRLIRVRRDDLDTLLRPIPNGAAA